MGSLANDESWGGHSNRRSHRGTGDHGNPPPYAQPGTPLLEEDLGPAHELVRRVLATQGIPHGAIDFRAPYRTAAGAPLHGSMLLDPKRLDQALSPWLLAPSHVVLIVDADEQPPRDRLEPLHATLERNGLRGAVGVSVQEFESWLVADDAALKQVLGHGSAPGKAESLPRGKAKELLAEWVALTSARSARNRAQLRRELAASLDLERLQEACPSFRAFADELIHLVR